MGNLGKFFAGACVAALALLLSACGLSEEDKTAMSKELIARGFTDPQLADDRSASRLAGDPDAIWSVGAGKCRVTLTHSDDGFWWLDNFADPDITRVKANAEALGLTACF